MEYGSPLHWRTMQFLAHDAVANFRVHGIGADAIACRPAVTAGLVPSLETCIVRTCEEFLKFVHRSSTLVVVNYLLSETAAASRNSALSEISQHILGVITKKFHGINQLAIVRTNGGISVHYGAK